MAAADLPRAVDGGGCNVCCIIGRQVLVAESKMMGEMRRPLCIPPHTQIDEIERTATRKKKAPLLLENVLITVQYCTVW